MRSAPFSALRIPALALLHLALLAPASAGADEFPLDRILATGHQAAFGQVSVVEDDDGGLAFTVALDPALLGNAADLRALHFNLPSGLTGVAVLTGDSVPTLYTLNFDHGLAGGDGARFDCAVSFGRGKGKRGNGILQQATFTLVADQALSLDDLDTPSESANGALAHVALRVHDADLGDGLEAVTLAGMREEETDGGECWVVFDPLTGGLVVVCP